jgi:hypothetical protein
MIKILLLGLSLLLFACNKPDPNPELNDKIYADLKEQAESTKKAIEETQKAIDEHKAEIDKVKPQTGQIKYATKRYWEAQDAMNALVQQKKYWEIRMQQRFHSDQVEYLKAFKEGKPWPNPKEYEEYMSEKRLRQSKSHWDVRKRMEEYKKENPTSGPAVSSTPHEPGKPAEPPENKE